MDLLNKGEDCHEFGNACCEKGQFNLGNYRKPTSHLIGVK